MAHLSGRLIHPSAWKGDSANFKTARLIFLSSIARTLSRVLRSYRGAEKERNMPDNPSENPPGREDEDYDETISDELLDEEELDAEEAERRITQFIISAED